MAFERLTFRSVTARPVLLPMRRPVVSKVGLFDRFSTMRHWVDNEHMAFEQFLSPDLLHMNDWSYACIAKLLASAIADGVKPPAATATIAPAAKR